MFISNTFAFYFSELDTERQNTMSTTNSPPSRTDSHTPREQDHSSRSRSRSPIRERRPSSGPAIKEERRDSVDEREKEERLLSAYSGHVPPTSVGADLRSDLLRLSNGIPVNSSYLNMLPTSSPSGHQSIAAMMDRNRMLAPFMGMERHGGPPLGPPGLWGSSLVDKEIQQRMEMQRVIEAERLMNMSMRMPPPGLPGCPSSMFAAMAAAEQERAAQAELMMRDRLMMAEIERARAGAIGGLPPLRSVDPFLAIHGGTPTPGLFPLIPPSLRDHARSSPGSTIPLVFANKSGPTSRANSTSSSPLTKVRSNNASPTVNISYNNHVDNLPTHTPTHVMKAALQSNVTTTTTNSVATATTNGHDREPHSR